MGDKGPLQDGGSEVSPVVCEIGIKIPELVLSLDLFVHQQ